MNVKHKVQGAVSDVSGMPSISCVTIYLLSQKGKGLRTSDKLIS